MDDLIERVARAWASIDGKADRFDKCKADVALDMTDGSYSGYTIEADELLKRSGVAAELTCLQARVAELEGERDDWMRACNLSVQERLSGRATIADLTAQLADNAARVAIADNELATVHLAAFEKGRDDLTAQLATARAETWEAAAWTCTSFLTGDPKSGIPLRSPTAHECAAALRAKAKEARG